MADMTREQAIYFGLPRHNDDWFAPATYAAKVAALAATYTADELRAAIAATEAQIARNQGVEFDDTRSRHHAGKAVSAFQAALAQQQETPRV